MPPVAAVALLLVVVVIAGIVRQRGVRRRREAERAQLRRFVATLEGQGDDVSSDLPVDGADPVAGDDVSDTLEPSASPVVVGPQDLPTFADGDGRAQAEPS